MQPQVFEGTWEEVQEGMRRLAHEHAGERVRLIVAPEPRATEAQAAGLPAARGISVEERIRLLDDLAVRNQGLPALPPEAFERESLNGDRLTLNPSHFGRFTEIEVLEPADVMAAPNP